MKKALKLLGWLIAACAAVSLIIDLVDHAKNKIKGHTQGFYERWIKRPLDFFCALGALVVLSPLMGITAWLVKKQLGSPVIFTQDRPGLNEKVFKLYKFRSMTDEKDEEGNLLPDEERLPKFGQMLRSTSLDELPELFNILKGDMSIVGPRPLLVKYLPYYTESERLRHDVSPGLTGLAQINGRNNVCWDDRLQYDKEYVENLSLIADLSIVFKTVYKVIKRSDVAVKRITPLDVERANMNMENK